MDTLLTLLTLLGAVVALAFAVITAKRVLRYDEGTERMIKISSWIRSGANAYLGWSWYFLRLCLPH